MLSQCPDDNVKLLLPVHRGYAVEEEASAQVSLWQEALPSPELISLIYCC